MESPNSHSIKSIISNNSNSNKQEINQEKDKNFIVKNQCECLIQHQYSIFVPAIVIKYNQEKEPKEKDKEFYGFDYNDLYSFIENFGEIENLEINSNVAIVLFRTFTDAYTCKEFLQNSNHFKNNERNYFYIDWYRREDEAYISDIFKDKIKRVSPATILDTIQDNSN